LPAPTPRQTLSANDHVHVVDQQYDALDGADALAVVTDWNQFPNPDFGRIKKMLRAPIIFDGRNLYSSSLVASQGFAYFSIGRPQIRNDR
jgi:UDPglucose 6-dehydrogenase